MHSNTFPELNNVHDTSLSAHHQERRTKWVVLVTALMMLVELTVGKLTGSMALTADGWHMATHVGALGLSAAAYWFARTRTGHQAFSFGTGKVYALAGYTSAVSLALIALAMGFESLSRLVQPVPIQFREALPVAVLGLLVNLLSVKLLDHDHDHDSHRGDARHHHDHNFRAAYIHLVADAMTSVLAIAALLSGRYLGWTRLDPMMGLVGAAIILNWAWSLCRGTSRQLLDACASEADELRLRHELEAIDDVRVADLHLWEIGPGRRSCVVALVTSNPREPAYYRERAHAVLDLSHLTVEVHRCEREHDGCCAP